jgi:hypothetical protein
MIEPTLSAVAVASRIIITAVVVLARVGLDRLSFRGRRTRHRGR